MFNLELAVQNWRRQMAAGGITSNEVLDELESHLRDDIEEQVSSGAEAEFAFDSAVRRIGTPKALREEFAKTLRLGAERGQRLLRAFYFVSAAVAILIDVWTLISFELSPPERVAGACAVSLFAWYLLSLSFLPGWRRGVPRRRLLGMMKAAGMIVPLWTLWALLTAIQVIHVKVGIIPELVMWSFCAAYGLTGLACAFHGGDDGKGGASGWLSRSNSRPRPIPPGRPSSRAAAIPVPSSAVLAPIAQRALEIARSEALLLGHDFIGTEHVLLGLLKVAKGALAQVLQGSKVHPEAVRAEIDRLVPVWPVHSVSTALALTPRARKALQFAGREADALKHPFIGAEHLLLGLLLEGSGVAALALKNLGIRAERVHDNIAGGSAFHENQED